MSLFRNLRKRGEQNPTMQLPPRVRRKLSSRLPVVIYQALADEQGSTVYVTGAIEQILGYSAAEWLAEPDAWYKALHPEDRQRVMRELQGMVDGESRELSYRIRHRSGDWRWIRDTTSLISHEDQRYYLGVMSDVTRERELERAHEESRRFFERLLHAGPWMLYKLAGNNLTVQYTSSNLREMLGLEAEQANGRPLAEFTVRVHPEDRQLFERHLQMLRQVGEDSCRLRFHRAPGEYRWIQLHAQLMEKNPDVFFGYVLDIHEQMSNEAFLRRYIERQRELNDLGRYAWEATQPEAFFKRAMEAIDRVLEPDFAAIIERVPGKDEMLVRAGVRVPAGTRFTLQDSQSGYTLRRAKPVVSHDLSRETRFKVPRKILEWGVASSLSVPIPGSSGPYGVLGIGFRDRLRIEETTIRFVQTVAHMIGQVLRQRHMLDDLQHKVYYDDLTGLPNRRALYRKLRGILADAKSTGAVVFLDLVDFGEVNDTWGHEVGDRLLSIAAERLNAGEAWTARWGGDEFVQIIEGQEPLAALERSLENLSRPLLLGGRKMRLAARSGVVLFREHGSDTKTLFRRADAALAAAKEQNRAVVEYYPDLEREAKERRSLVESLRLALESREGLYLEFQPILRLDSEKVEYAEALLRWRNPRSGKLMPDTFIPLAERYGLSPRLDRYVLEMAVATGAGWIERCGEEAPALSVNVSADSFSDPEFATDLRELLSRYGYPPERLSLELTERVLADRDKAAPALAALRELGVRVVVDDFGTGYSSLAYLAYLGIDGLKVDRVFISDIGRNERTEAVLRSVFSLGDNLKIKVVAEGVETQDQYDWLANEGCTLVQGYFAGRPLPEPSFYESYLRPRAGRA